MRRALGGVAGAWAAATLGLGAPGAAAQDPADRTLFPPGSYFGVPTASVREPNFGLSLLRTDVLGPGRGGGERPPFDAPAPGAELQVAAALGATLRVWRPLRWRGGGLVTGLQAGTFARFRMEVSSNDLVATDWIVALPVEAARDRLSGRLRLVHWSAHIGDEFRDASGAERIDFTYEALELLGAWSFGDARVYGGGAVTLGTELEDPDIAAPVDDSGQLQVGADARWHPLGPGRTAVSAGIDLQWAGRSRWRNQLAAVVGVEMRAGARALRVSGSVFDGPSALGSSSSQRSATWASRSGSTCDGRAPGMIDTVLTAIVLGFFAGAVPGPYTTMVATTALDRGFAPAFRLAFVPVVTDIPPMLITAMVLDRVSYDVLTVVGVLGGLVMAGLGIRYFRLPGKTLEDAEQQKRSERRNFWAVASAGLLSPAPWIFWTVAASPLLLSSWNRHWFQGVLFAALLFTMLIGTATAIAWGASHGHKRMAFEKRAAIVRVVGVLLIVAGGVMVWQSFEGNFQSMVKRQELLRDAVERGVNGVH